MNRNAFEKNRGFIGLIATILLTILIVAMIAGCSIIDKLNENVPGGNSTVQSDGTNSGKQFNQPSNGGYYPAN